MTKTKNIILCADDFGLSAEISKAILTLVDAGRLSAVSCMSSMPDFAPVAAQLVARKQRAQLGLHFNLTEGQLLAHPERDCFTLNQLLLKTHLRLSDRSLIAAELHAQIDRYVELMGALPDFIDGHQHVHQFPQIRDILLRVYQQRLINKPWVRVTYPAVMYAPYRFKTAVLGFTGGRVLSVCLKQLAIAHNTLFAGIYDFAADADYRHLFRHWLEEASTNTLIMCHPGLGERAEDAIAHARLNEFHYLGSDAFLVDCAEFGVSLAGLASSY